MEATSELRYDHEVLRARLALLEEWLPSLYAAPFSIFRLADSLACHLRTHTEKEDRLFARLAPYGEGALADSIQRLSDEHENQRTRLAILHALLSQPDSASAEQATTQASHLIQDLREHMAREERLLFSALDREEAPRGSSETAAVDEESVQMLGLA